MGVAYRLDHCGIDGASRMITIDPNVVIALIAGAVAITTAAFVFLNARISDLRNRFENAERTNHSLWAYCRKLINHIYVHTGAEPPKPDSDIAHLFTKE